MKKKRVENMSNKLTKTNLQNFITRGSPGRGHAVQRQRLKVYVLKCCHGGLLKLS